MKDKPHERFERIMEGMKQAHGIKRMPKGMKCLRMNRTARQFNCLCQGDCEPGNHLQISS